MSEHYEQFKQLFRQGRYLEAASFAELQYRQQQRENPFWLTRQAAALCRAAEYEQALAVARRALDCQPANPYAIVAVAEALLGLGSVEEARIHYEAVADEPQLSVYARQGFLSCLEKLKHWDRMLQLLTDWQLPPAMELGWRVKALAGKHRLDEAIAVCRQWLKLKPDFPEALWALAELEIQRDGLDSTLARLARLARIPSRPPVYKKIYASLCRRAGKPELALNQYAKLARSGADPGIYRQQAFALAKSGREVEAMAIFEELMRRSPKDYYLHNAYVSACGRVQQLDRALKFYEELLEKYPQEKSLYGRIKKLKNRCRSENQDP